MPNLNPANPEEQLGESSNRWAEVHGYTLNTAALRLDRLTPLSPRYTEFATANSRYLHQRKDGILYLGNAQIAYFTDFEGTRNIVQRFLAEEGGTGVSSEHPYIPATYDTLFSIATALVELDAYRAATDARLASLEGEGGCCDVALAEISDVMLDSPQSGQALVYDASTGAWVNQAVSVLAALDDLSDVQLTNSAQGQVLRYDGTLWANASLSIPAKISDLDDVHVNTNVSTRQVLVYDPSTPDQGWSSVDQVRAAGGDAILQITDGNGGFTASDVRYISGAKKALLPADESEGQIDIGSDAARFRDLYLTGSAYVGANSVYIGDKLSLSADGDTLLVNGSAVKVGGSDAFPPVGDEGAIQVAGKNDEGFMYAPIRGVFSSDASPAYTLDPTPIVFDDSAPSSTTLQLNHTHTFSVRSDAVHVSGIWSVPSTAAPGDALSVYVHDFGISPDFKLQIGFHSDPTTNMPFLRYVASPNDTSTYTSNNGTFGTVRLTNTLQVGKTYSFWYADEGSGNTVWYYSENGFPVDNNLVGAVVEPLAPAGSNYGGVTFPTVNLGSPTNRFGTLYLMGNTIDLGGTQLSATQQGQLVVSTGSGGTTEPFATETFVTTAVSESAATLTALIANKADVSALTAETNTRTSADTALGQRIDAETAARTAAVVGINTALGAYVTASSHSADLALKLSVQSFNSYVNGTLSTQLVALGTNISALDASKQDKLSIGAGLALSSAGTLSAAAIDLSGYATVTALSAAVVSAQTYTDSKFNMLVGSGTLSAALDTFVEIAGAIGTNQDAVTAINTAILTKADKSATISGGDGIVTSGSLGSGVNVSLATVSAGTFTYGSATEVPVITVDKYGRVTSATTAAIPAGFSGDYNDLTNAPTLSNYATAASLSAVSDRVQTLEDAGYLTAASTISSARLDRRSFTITTPSIDDADIVVELGDAVTAASLAAALSEQLDIRRSLADLIGVNISGATLVSGQYLKYDGSQWVAGDVGDFTTGVTSVNGQSGALTLEIVSPDELASTLSGYVTASSFAESLALKLTAATFTEHVTALSDTLARKVDVGTLSAFTASYAAYQQSTSQQLSALGASITAVSAAVDVVSATLSNYATAAAVSASISGLSSQIAGKQDSFAVDGGIELVGGTLQTTFDIADYATSASLTAATASIGAALDLKLSIEAFNHYTTGTLTDALSAKADAAALSAYTLSAGLRFNDVEADVVSLGGSLATLTTDLASLTGDVAAYTLATNGRLDAVDGDVLSLSGELGGLTTSLADEVTHRVAADTTLQGNIDAKQDRLTAGSNISLSGATISVAATFSSAVATNTAKLGFTNALARAAISAGGDISYNSSTGVMSYSSAWAQSGGVVTASAPVVITGYMLELFDFGDAALDQTPSMTLDAGALSAPIDRIVDLGTLDQGRLF